MCGISGIIAKNYQDQTLPLRRMLNTISYRGPDATKMEILNGCVLGHNRLSIIDIKTGGQPMSSTSNNLTIVFNGEIYGYSEIKKRLTDYCFQTTSDTEVILALYEKYQEKCVNYLSGMFAFAIWDKQKKELFCARDRFGEKPFYYCFGNNGEFLFASEIKALISSGLIKPILDIDSLSNYLQYLYISPLRTVYKNIYTLSPAHTLKYKDGNVLLQKYWLYPQIETKIAFGDASEKFSYLLEQSVKKQLIADVPLGIFLSGGLDSSTIVALASKYKSPLKTFSFGFEQAKNELPYAQAVAHRYHTDHQILTPRKVDIGETLLEMQNIYDEPFADSSNIPTFLLAQLAAKHVKVVLTGDGGDEMLGGYSWYRPLLSLLKSKQKWQYSDFKVTIFLNYLRQFHNQTSHIGKNLSSIYKNHRERQKYFTDQEITTLGCQLKNSVNSSWKQFKTINQAFYADINSYLPGDILVKIDRAAMANSLELRAPFLDKDLANFCLSLPFTFKLSPYEQKIILRKSFKSCWPKIICNRQKQGFGAPVKEWLQLDSVKSLKEKYLTDSRNKIYSLLPREEIVKYTPRDNYQTWVFLVLSLWLEKHDFIYET